MMSVSPFSPPITVGPQESCEHTHTMIFLHGRSGSGEEISKELFDEESSEGLSLRQRFPSWRWIFPTSPSSYNETFQETMREWFSIHSLTNPDEEVECQIPGLREAVGYIHSLIQGELRDVPSHRLFLGGISQGGATGLAALLSRRHKLGGFVMVCGWMPFQKHIRELIHGDVRYRSTVDQSHGESERGIFKFYSENLQFEDHIVPTPAEHESTALEKSFAPVLKTPVFIGHSINDCVVDIGLARGMRDTLNELGLSVTWIEYQDAGHWISEPEGVDDLMRFLATQANSDPS